MSAVEGSEQEHQKRATMLDVARHAGVSHQTVSRYLRNNGGLKPATIERIDRAVQELDYRPNLIARSMRTMRSNRIAVVLPELSEFVPTATLRGAAGVAHEAGLLIDVVSLEGNERNRRDRVLELLDGERVDGILSLTPLGEILDYPQIPGLAPIVVVGEYDDKMRSRGVFADGALASEIIEYLASLGHRRFLHVAGSSEWASARNRRDVYIETVDRLGLESYGVVDGDWSLRSGYEAARDLPSNSGVTAVLGANDYVALGVIRGFQDRGVRVPDDVSVFGWDDEQFTQYMSPTMSTVALDKERQGRQAMQTLIARVRGETPPLFDVEKTGRLIFRGSSGPAPRI
ncbi:LacI family DNA-binding transcriptional regulator [Leifsonia sp. 2MCAF36]|uniref:LacI family DNA-binding transcriptional regulator n=1 Tax=Leifsonia sp. 2MCAF36 TaxID=3232988 RepID=UPI003F96C956